MNDTRRGLIAAWARMLPGLASIAAGVYLAVLEAGRTRSSAQLVILS